MAHEEEEEEEEEEEDSHWMSAIKAMFRCLVDWWRVLELELERRMSVARRLLLMIATFFGSTYSAGVRTSRLS